MRRVTFCVRCRGMEVAWNRKYLTHCLVCRGFISKSLKILAYGVMAAFVVSIFPTTTAVVFSNQTETSGVIHTGSVTGSRAATVSGPAIHAIENLLDRHSYLNPVERSRVARAVVASARKYDVDPHLVASILLVESGGDPFAISSRDAVGIMQIHVPTWHSLVDLEKINLFRVEDNIDLGTRILKDYTDCCGLWDGVMRYLGADGPTERAVEYVRRVQGIYTDRHAD